MKNNLQIIAVFFLFVLLSSCQKEFLKPNDDTDAQRFIDSSGITNPTEKLAINNFVKQLKDSTLWIKFLAVYPMVGGTAATTKWNLKDPRDLDAAYRLTFTGAPVFTNNGVLFTPGTSADTHLSDNLLTYNNAAISYYSKTQNSSAGYDIGCSDSIPPFNELSIGKFTEWFGLNDTVAHVTTTDLYLLSSTATDSKRYDNNKLVLSLGYAPGNTYTNSSFLLGKSAIGQQGFRECALATIGMGLTDAQALTFYNIVQNFEATLGR